MTLDSMEGNGRRAARVGDCRECGARLAHDQRYCVACGARRGALPARIAQAITRIRERGVAEALRAPAIFETPEREPGRFDAWLVAPRAAAVAVLGMLGFGVLVGSLVGESAASTYTPVIVEMPHHGSQAGSPAAGSLGAGGGGGGGGGVQTETVTVGSTTPPPSSTAPAQTGSTTPTTSTTSTTTTSSNGALPPVKHVFVIVLSNQGYNQTFAHTGNDPYLAKTLAGQGELITNYYAVAGGSLANEIAMISGQGPTPDTVSDCPTYANIEPGKKGARGQILGNGCVYPKRAHTLPGELTSAKLSWKAYVQSIKTGRQAQLQACSHPALGAAERPPSSKDPYAAWRNPFLYFHTLAAPSTCSKHDVPLTELAGDLKSAKTTPSLVWIVPDLCDDGSDSPCGAGAASGMGPADTFLKSVVPKIKRSPAYKDGGLIAITFDQAPQTGPNADPSSCCEDPKYPNVPSTTTTSTTSTMPTTPTTSTTSSTTSTGTTTSTTPSTTTTTSTTPTTTTNTTTTSPSTSLGIGVTNPTGGGGQVGLLLISPFIKPGLGDVIDYFNHFSLLASIEDLFGLKRTGYGNASQLPVFGASVYDNYTPG